MKLRGNLLVGLCGLGLVGAVANDARAHFLFVEVGPMAEGGRAAEVYFSEQAEAGDPKFVDKIAGTKLWIQTSKQPGTFEPLSVHKAADRLRAGVPASGNVAVVGVCEYGVLARPNQTPFLLRYYPKAIAGKPEALNTLKPADLPAVALEIAAQVDAGQIKLRVLRSGQPVKGAVFHTVDSSLNNSEVAAGADGTAVWTPPGPGQYSVYVKEVLKQSGELSGKHYDEIREFATLALAWPLDRTDADSEAVELFQKALATRATWPGFTGFSAKIEGSVDGRPFKGKITVAADGSAKAEVDDAVARPWLEDQVGSLAMHRLPDDDRGASGSDRPKPVLRFADDDENHPLGRLLTFQGGRFASSYRIKDDQIMVVNRQAGPQNFTITVLDNERTPEGKFLPHDYLVQYWDGASGKLDRVETFQDAWTRVGEWDLPTRHTMTTTSSSGLSVRSVSFSEHQAAKAK
jgi:hypothetical protein